MYVCSLWYRHSLQVFFLTGDRDSHLQTVTIPEAAYIQLRRTPPEDGQGNAQKCKSSFLTGAQDSHLQRVTIPEAAHIQL